MPARIRGAGSISRDAIDARPAAEASTAVSRSRSWRPGSSCRSVSAKSCRNRPPPAPDLDEVDRALHLFGLERENARQRPGERRRNVRRRDEVPGLADRRAARVVALLGIVQRGLHEVEEGDRSLARDALAQPVLERGHVARHYSFGNAAARLEIRRSGGRARPGRRVRVEARRDAPDLRGLLGRNLEVEREPSRRLEGRIRAGSALLARIPLERTVAGRGPRARRRSPSPLGGGLPGPRAARPPPPSLDPTALRHAFDVLRRPFVSVGRAEVDHLRFPTPGRHGARSS